MITLEGFLHISYVITSALLVFLLYEILSMVTRVIEICQ
jgi:hypothetical protein